MDATWDDEGLYRDTDGQRVGAVLYTPPRDQPRGDEWSAIFPHRSIGRHATEAEARAQVEQAYRAWTDAQEAARRR